LRAVGAELKEVVLFLDFFVRTVVVRANAVIGLDLGFGEKGFIARTIPSLVFTLVDLVFERLPN
jgi:hypothetical protein